MIKEIPTLLTIRQFSTKHNFITEGGLRYQIFNAEKNGLKEAEVIVKVGKKLLINEGNYFNWMGV